jgi:hypothetical protein
MAIDMVKDSKYPLESNQKQSGMVKGVWLKAWSPGVPKNGKHCLPNMANLWQKKNMTSVGQVIFSQLHVPMIYRIYQKVCHATHPSRGCKPNTWLTSVGLILAFQSKMLSSWHTELRKWKTRGPTERKRGISSTRIHWRSFLRAKLGHGPPRYLVKKLFMSMY